MVETILSRGQHSTPTSSLVKTMSSGTPLTVTLALLISTLWGAAHGDLNLRPERVPQGQFRIRCEYAHSAKDDPIMKPNQPGKSHSHDFFGFKAVSAYTTNATKFIGKPTTCVLKADTAAYWFPSVFQRRAKKEKNGKYAYDQLVPRWTLFYYRTAVNNPQVIKTIPPNLKMVTGNPFAGLKYVNVEWWCGVYGKHFSNFPEEACKPNVALIGKLNFPSCWNGKDTSSPDGKSHMLHIELNTTCPKSHPIAIPRISIKIYYPVRSGLVMTWPKGGRAADPPLYLSTYDSGGTGSGHEYHADFMNGWEPTKLQQLVSKCINKNKKCDVQADTPEGPNPFDDGPSCGGKAC